MTKLLSDIRDSTDLSAIPMGKLSENGGVSSKATATDSASQAENDDFDAMRAKLQKRDDADSSFTNIFVNSKESSDLFAQILASVLDAGNPFIVTCMQQGHVLSKIM
jgi:hypothetical protein